MHVSVLNQAVIDWLKPHADGLYIDGTLGFAGHTVSLLQASAPNGRVLAFDRDPEALAFATERLKNDGDDYLPRVTLVHASFADMGSIAPAHGFAQVDGIVLDLGLSSLQMDTPERGFSFRFEAPLDMRFDPEHEVSAEILINNLSQDELSTIFWRYGEEKRSRQIARWVVENRPIQTTTQLADLISERTPAKMRKRVHPATQVFQALRIAVNDELSALSAVLPQAIELLKPGGRLAVISFHSLEDRIVKQTFRQLATSCICPPQQPICTCDNQAQISLPKRKAIKASEAEIVQNKRSRSARLRIAEKL